MMMIIIINNYYNFRHRNNKNVHDYILQQDVSHTSKFDPLHWAAIDGDLKLIRKLLHEGASTCINTKVSNSPLCPYIQSN